MSRKILKTYNRFIAFFMSLLGFGSSCNPLFSGAEYGVPQATYEVNGTAVSKQNGAPVQNIQAISGYDTAYSDAAGNFKIRHTEMETGLPLMIEFKDVDGLVNGSFENKDTTIVFSSAEFKGRDGKWNLGTAVKTIVVKLTPKK